MDNAIPHIAPEPEKPAAPRKGKWRRRILRTTAVLFGLPLCLLVLLSFSFFQTFLAGFALSWLSDKIQFEIKAQRLYFDAFNGSVTLEGVEIRDRQGKKMITVAHLHADFDYNTVLKNGDISLKDVVLKKGNLHLILDKKTKNLNIEEFIENIDKLTESKEPKKDKTPSVFNILKARLQDVNFTYDDNRQPHEQGKEMDYAHFGLDHIHADLQRLRIVADTVDVQINGMRARETKTRLPIHNFTTRYFMTRTSMDFRNLYLSVGKSIVRDQLFMMFDSQRDLSDFVEKVTLVAHLDSTILDTRDLAVFSPAVGRYKDVWRATGIMRGRVNNFVFRDLQLGWGKGSLWRGYAAMKGLPNIDSTYMNLDFREAKLYSRDLLQYVDQEDANKILERLGEVAIFKGKYKGFIHDFEAGGSFQTDLGEFDTQMRLVLGDGRQAPYYKATFSTPDLQIGTLLGVSDLRNVAVEGHVEGTGFSPETAKLRLDTEIKFADFNQYRYQNIAVKGDISRQSFAGEAHSKDANLDFDLKGTVDFSPTSKTADKPAGHFDLTAKIRHVDLQALHFMPQKTTMKGDLQVNMHGLHLDSLQGSAILENAEVNYRGKQLTPRRIDFHSFKAFDGDRILLFQSDYANVNVEGKFLFSDLMEDLPALAYEYWLSLENKKSKIDAYYSKKKNAKEKDYRTKFDLTLPNVNPLAKFLDLDMYVSPNSSLQGEFVQQRTSRLNLYTEHPVDSLFYSKYKFYGSTLELTSSKQVLTSDVLASILFKSTRQLLSGFELEDTSIEAAWGREGIDFETRTQQAKSLNHAKLMGNLRLQNDTTLLSITQSDLRFYDDHWAFDKNSRLSINPLAVVLENIVLRNPRANAQISAKGMISDQLATPLEVELKQIDLSAFAKVLGTDIDGSLNGQFTMANLTKKPDIKGELVLENLMYRNMLVGDIDGAVQWKDDLEKLEIDLTGFRKGRYILSLMGGYYPNKPNEALDLEAKFNRTDLEIFEPFVDGFVSKVRGNLLGKIFIKGKLAEPEVTGKLRINNGSAFRFNMLNTYYDVEGEIVLLKDEIFARNISLYDEQTNAATVNFKLYHDNFKHFYLDTDARFYRGFQVMNMPAAPNCMYYGTAFASGEARIRGYLDNLEMNVRAKPHKNTKIFLPLDGYQEVGAKDYIHFITTAKKDSLKVSKINLGGMRLNFNLELNPNAEFEVIIDSRTGDAINAKGKGNIDMRINTEGDLSILGTYNIQQGHYKFTFANLINKEFNITPNSTIVFNGDVYSSQLDVRALYERPTALRPLVDMTKVSDPNNPEYRRPYNVKATLDMKGSLFTPEVKLGLDLSEATNKIQNINLRAALLQLETQIANDEQERNRQVFSLLILGQLSQPNAFTVTGAAAGSSISEMLSNQFSNWISQVDEDLELNFNVADVSNLGSYQLRVSYSFLDGRLRITRDGGFTNTQNQADISNVLGDWTLEYLLTSNGKYRLKTYRRNNTGIANANGTASNINAANTATMGVSFMYTAGFNRLVELFEKKTATSGLRLDSETEEVVSTFGEKPVTETPFKKEEPIVVEEENLFPLKHRQDSLPNSYKPVMVEKVATPTEIKSNTPRTDYNSNPDNTIDNAEIPEQFRTKPSKVLPTPAQTKQAQETHIINHVGKVKPDAMKAGMYPVPHRFGR